MSKLYLLLLFLFCSLNLVARNGQPVHVIITAGQSNTDGRTSNRDLPEYIKAFSSDTVAYSEGAYKYCHIAQNDAEGLFVPFWPRASRNGNNHLWAYDAVVYYELEQMLKEKFYVIKWAVGGTSIAPSSHSPKGRYWSADAKWLSQTCATSEGGNSLLLSFIREIDVCIDHTLSKLKEGYRIDAFLWHQGESDYRQGKAYYGNLKALVAYVRSYLSKKTGEDYSNLPFIFGTVSKANKCYSSEVEAGMRRLAEEEEHVYMIDMSEGELQRDRLHFTAKSAEYLGKQMFNRLARIIADKSLCRYQEWASVQKDELAGKRFGIIGDSYVKNHKESVEKTWHYKFAQKHGMQYFNYGKNGSSIAYSSSRWGKAMYLRYKEMADSLDYIVVVGGHNDSYKLDSIGGIDVFKERLAILCEGILNKYPTAKIFFFTRWNTKNFHGSDAEKVVDAMLEVCGRYNIPVFDSARKGGIYVSSDAFRKAYFQPSKNNTDTAHLNEKGHDRFLKVAEHFLLQY